MIADLPTIEVDGLDILKNTRNYSGDIDIAAWLAELVEAEGKTISFDDLTKLFRTAWWAGKED